MTRTWRRAVLLVVFAGFLLSAAPTMGASAQKPADDQESSTVQQTAVEYYTREHGVSKDVALRHLEIQDRAMPSMGTVEKILGDRYGGAWFNPADGGRLTIAVVDLDSETSASAVSRVEDLLRDAGALSATGFDNVEFGYDELVQASHEMAKGLDGLSKGDRGGVPTVGVDVRRNALVVTRTADASAAARERLAEVKQATNVPVRETTAPPGSEPQTRCMTTGPALSPFCDRPLRGGVEIGNGGSCTAGFNVTSRSDGKRYVMTAGHCALYWWDTKTQVYGQWQYIGTAHNMLYYYTGKDAGIIRNEVPSYWQQSPFPTSTIWVDGLSGVTAYDPSYYISNEANAVVGNVVCVTGGGGLFNGNRARFWEGTQWASYTWCGTVTLASDAVVYWGQASETVYDLVRTDLCFHGGMSGGPVYKNHLAYGVISGDYCPTQQYGWFYPAILAENALNVNIVH